TKPEVEDIADEAVKQKVLARLGDGDPKKVFSNLENLPYFETQDGRRIPIKRVRINKAVPTFPLGDGKAARHVTSESNHHLEIFAELDEEGNEVEWDGVVVSMAEAYRRKKEGLPIVQRDFGTNRRFKFSLAPGEVIECTNEAAESKLMVVRSISQFTTGQIQVGLVPISDARKKADIIKAGAFVRPGPNTLRQMHARKVVVSPLGEVSSAGD